MDRGNYGRGGAGRGGGRGGRNGGRGGGDQNQQQYYQQYQGGGQGGRGGGGRGRGPSYDSATVQRPAQAWGPRPGNPGGPYRPPQSGQDLGVGRPESGEISARGGYGGGGGGRGPRGATVQQPAQAWGPRPGNQAWPTSGQDLGRGRPESGENTARGGHGGRGGGSGPWGGRGRPASPPPTEPRPGMDP